jgi:hypothetical protein
MGKSTINKSPFSIAMLNYQRVTMLLIIHGVPCCSHLFIPGLFDHCFCSGCSINGYLVDKPLQSLGSSGRREEASKNANFQWEHMGQSP